MSNLLMFLSFLYLVGNIVIGVVLIVCMLKQCKDIQAHSDELKSENNSLEYKVQCTNKELEIYLARKSGAEIELEKINRKLCTKKEELSKCEKLIGKQLEFIMSQAHEPSFIDSTDYNIEKQKEQEKQKNIEKQLDEMMNFAPNVGADK